MMCLAVILKIETRERDAYQRETLSGNVSKVQHQRWRFGFISEQQQWGSSDSSDFGGALTGIDRSDKKQPRSKALFAVRLSLTTPSRILHVCRRKPCQVKNSRFLQLQACILD